MSLKQSVMAIFALAYDTIGKDSLLEIKKTTVNN